MEVRHHIRSNVLVIHITFGHITVLIYLTVTGRNDWSSTLPVNNRSYFYPSVSGSFVFTELLPKNNVLSFGKIRGSWARVGKDADAYSLGYYMYPVDCAKRGAQIWSFVLL